VEAGELLRPPNHHSTADGTPSRANTAAFSSQVKTRHRLLAPPEVGDRGEV